MSSITLFEAIFKYLPTVQCGWIGVIGLGSEWDDLNVDLVVRVWIRCGVKRDRWTTLRLLKTVRFMYVGVNQYTRVFSIRPMVNLHEMMVETGVLAAIMARMASRSFIAGL